MKKIVMLSCLVGIVASCTTDENLLVKEESASENLLGQTIVLKERDPKYPLEFPERKTRGLVTPYVVSSEADYLGCSYKLDVFPLGTAENVGCQIIDMEKLKEEEPFYVTEKNLGIQTADYFSYANLDRYGHKSKDVDKVTSGFELNLGLFSIGHKKTITNIYSESVENETNRVYGELNVDVLAKNYTLTVSSNLANKIKLYYQNPSFRDELYSITPREFINLYGPLVLTDFYTGGRVSAIYSGMYNASASVENIEEDVDRNISASFGNKKDSTGTSGSVSFGIGAGYSSETSMSSNITNFTMSVKAIGGKLSLPAFTMPKELSQVSIDLSSWMSSMDESTYRMMDIKDGGLRPVADFILEDNLRRHFYTYLKENILLGRLDSETVEPIEPYLNIVPVSVPNDEVELYMFLVTKNSDYILLKSISKIPSELQEEYVQQMVDKYSKEFGLKIVCSSESAETTIYAAIMHYPIYFDENCLSKYVDEDNDTMYLLYDGKDVIVDENLKEESFLTNLLMQTYIYSENISKVHYYKIDENGVHHSIPDKGKYGFTLYNYKRTLNLYGMTDFVEKLPTVEIDKEELLDYTLFAL